MSIRRASSSPLRRLRVLKAKDRLMNTSSHLRLAWVLPVLRWFTLGTFSSSHRDLAPVGRLMELRSSPVADGHVAADRPARRTAVEQCERRLVRPPHPVVLWIGDRLVRRLRLLSARSPREATPFVRAVRHRVRRSW